eukprot:SAG11_NODE_6127_length_1383_cov_1.566978_1_plen_173_part_10
MRHSISAQQAAARAEAAAICGVEQQLAERARGLEARISDLRVLLAAEFTVVGSGATMRFARRLRVRSTRRALRAAGGVTMLEECRRLQAQLAHTLEQLDSCEHGRNHLAESTAALECRLREVDAALPGLRPTLRAERGEVRARRISLHERAAVLHAARGKAAAAAERAALRRA